MKSIISQDKYFPHSIQISGEIRDTLELTGSPAELAARAGAPAIIFYRLVADRLNCCPPRRDPQVTGGGLAMFALLNRIFSHLLDTYLDEQYPGLEDDLLARSTLDFAAGPLSTTIDRFAALFPCDDLIAQRVGTVAEYLDTDDARRGKRRRVTREMLLLRLSMENRALRPFRDLFDDRKLCAASPYVEVATTLDTHLKEAPPYVPLDLPILELLRVPLRAFPDSLSGQLEFIRENWSAIIPLEMLEEILSAFDIIREEERRRLDGPGPPHVLEFGRAAHAKETPSGGDYPEPERFSPDTEWMPNVVLIAKMVYVWLDQLTKKYARPINRLDQIPDEELDTLAAWGFTGLWLIGVWERSPASVKIKQLCGNPDAISSAYSLYDYVIAADLGGDEALENLRRRASRRGIRMASDMVPNHTGIDSRWTREHPDWFIQLDYPPYPAYRFDGPDLSSSPDISLRIEDGYWSKTDAAVVFQHVDNRTGRVRYLYHGNDGTSTPWNDTAQLNYLVPEVREAVIRTIIHVARSFPIIRFDAAMTLAKKHYQRLWFPQVGLGGGIPSRAEHALSRPRFDELFPVEFWREVVDRVAAEVPDTLLLAEAFWLMEGYFVRTLGMHRVYNSAFMNMLKMEENAKYRQTIKNVLEFNPEILQRFVNFMNNPDESTAIEQFGREGKYFGAALLLVTMPGLPMFGHGQIEGFTEKYGMEYRRAYWSETVDRHLVEMHERRIFPLMKKRSLFSGAENFVLYDFHAGDRVDENVFAYSNSRGDERALIVYHNRFASTAGWIRTSSLRTVKDAPGTTIQVRTTLGEALGVRSDGRYYYRFRDSITGLEYLRHGPELADRGIHVALDAYDYHAFLEFREIRDDDYGNWGKLCSKLNGSPVGSLDEEFRQVRHAGVIAAFAALAHALRDTLPILFERTAPAASREQSEEILRERMLSFFSSLKQEIGISGDPANASGKVLKDLDDVAASGAMKTRRKGARLALELMNSLLGPDRGFNRLLLSLWLVLRRCGSTADDAGPASDATRLLVELGLARAAESVFGEAAESSPDLASPWGIVPAVRLLKLLLGRTFPAATDMDGCHEWLEKLFADENARHFLQVHLSDNIEWFSKERFEDLLHWFLLTAIPAIPTRPVDKGLMERELTRLHGVVSALIADAARAGYRTDRFLRIAPGRSGGS
ncbi:alpha-amylase [bacterium]|nr:alpha-amylase [bacterium]